MSDIQAVIAGAASLVVVFVVLMVGVVRGAHYIDSSSCRGFGQASGYEVKFVDYNFWNWDCLAKTADGKWVSTQRLHDVNVEPR